MPASTVLLSEVFKEEPKKPRIKRVELAFCGQLEYHIRNAEYMMFYESQKGDFSAAAAWQSKAQAYRDSLKFFKSILADIK